jgi:HEAT repeat protein
MIMPLFGPPNIEEMKVRQDIKGLIKALHHPDPKIDQSAAGALAQIGEPVLDSVIAATQDPYINVRIYTSWILGQIRSPRGLGPLVARLSDPVKNVRLSAIQSLGAFGDGRATKALLTALKSVDGDVRQCARDALDKIGKVREMDPLIAVLQDSDKGVRHYAVVALGQLRNNYAMEALIAAVRDSDSDVRKAAVEALGKLDEYHAVKSLITAFRAAIINGGENDEPVRQLVAKTLIGIGSPAVEPLIEELKHQDWHVNRTAADVLGQIAVHLEDAALCTSIIEALIAIIKEKGTIGYLRLAVLEALDVVFKAADWKPSQDEIGAAYWMAKKEWDKCVTIGAPAVDVLIPALKDSDKDVRLAVVSALGEIKDARAAEPLVNVLFDSDNDVRKAAALALEEFGVPAVDPLIATLTYSSSEAARTAARILVHMYKALPPGEAQKHLILAQRDLITSHYDGPCSGINDCGIPFYGGHGDKGIGVDFPL